jgi:hypothetical protein
VCLRFVFLLASHLLAPSRLSRRDAAWHTAEILLLQHQLAVLQRELQYTVPWGEVVGYVSPGDSRAVEIQQGVDDIAEVRRGRRAGGAAIEAGLLPGGDGGLDQGPAGVGEV